MQTLAADLAATSPSDRSNPNAAFSGLPIEFSTTFSPTAARSLRKLAKACDCERLEDQPHFVLLAAYTHFALQARLYAWSALQRERKTPPGACRDSLLRFFSQLEDADALASHGAGNYPALPALRWYLDSWNPGLAESLAQMARDIFHDTRHNTSHRQLQLAYQTLIPRAVRHQLGEYYTPPWLAEHVLTTAEYQGKPSQRILDPCCGSGVFLTAAVAQAKDHAAQNHLSPEEALATILNNVVGIDLNPLAVLAAQTNYLLALGDLLDHRSDNITLPVYQADALLGGGLPPLGEFDVIAGNPPWVGWETLTPEIRQQTRPLWEKLGLFPHGGIDAILGRGKKDLSLLMSYVVSDRWLKTGGKLSFLITQSAFKTVGAAQGFRRFQLGDDGELLGVTLVEDLAALPVFDGAATRTAIVNWTKGESTGYPLPYQLWQQTSPGHVGTGPSLREVAAMTRRLPLSARPADPNDLTSIWLTGRAAALQAVAPLFGASPYVAREGVNTGGANGVYWVRVLEQTSPTTTLIENLHTAGRRELPQVQAEVETALLYPILRGREVRRWQAQPEARVLLVQDVNTRRGIDLETMQQQYPLTLDYLNHFETTLRNRAALKRYFQRRRGGQSVETGAFYSMFNVGPYTLAPFKVVWHRMVTPVEAAVIQSQGEPPILPQETHAFIPCGSADEAYYLAGLLNSTPLEFAARSYSQVGGKSFASPHLLKHLHLPKFDPSSRSHVKVAATASDVQSTCRVVNESRREKLTEELDTLAAAVWDLDDRQLAEIKQALHELIFRP